MTYTGNQNKKPKKKNKSLIFMIVIICLMFAGGLGLILYPFFTNIPSYFQKGEQISQWELEKKSAAAEDEDTSSENGMPASTSISDSDEIISGENNETGSEDTQTADTDPYEDNKDAVMESAIKETSGTDIYTAEDMFPAKLSIPRIDVEWITNEGADIATLKKGPGHIPETPLPGEIGRCTISGHRTTYGAPFNRIDELEKGDLIYLETLNNLTFVYKVTDVEVVVPTYVEILIGSDKKELLLTTCYPEYSARERMVIISELINIYNFDFNLR